MTRPDADAGSASVWMLLVASVLAAAVVVALAAARSTLRARDAAGIADAVALSGAVAEATASPCAAARAAAAHLGAALVGCVVDAEGVTVTVEVERVFSRASAGPTDTVSPGPG